MKKIINTNKAPMPVGPYSQAILAGKFLYISGQIALDPATGEMVSGDIEVHTKQIMENIRGILAAAGVSFSKVVKSTIFLTNIDDFAKANKVYASYFAAAPPARSCMEVAALPKGAFIEIEMIAVVD